MSYFTCPLRPEHYPAAAQQQRAAALDPFLQALFSQFAQPVAENSASSNNTDKKMSTSAPVSTSHPAASKPTPTPRQPNRSNRSFSPRFDVYETEDAYHLEGDLPGVVDKKSIGIEFSDERTLMVRGTVERGVKKPAMTREQKRKSLNPTVEDDTDEEDEYSLVSKHEPDGAVVKVEVEEDEAANEPPKKIWLSERTYGTFQRTFNFPTPVDLGNVGARLEHGLLEIRVPKMRFAGVRKIEVM